MAVSFISQRYSPSTPQQPQIKTDNDIGMKLTTFQSQEQARRPQVKNHEQRHSALTLSRSATIASSVMYIATQTSIIAHLFTTLLHVVQYLRQTQLSRLRSSTKPRSGGWSHSMAITSSKPTSWLELWAAGGALSYSLGMIGLGFSGSSRYDGS